MIVQRYHFLICHFPNSFAIGNWVICHSLNTRKLWIACFCKMATRRCDPLLIYVMDI